MPHVLVADSVGQLDFNGDYSPVGALHDQVDLAGGVLGAEMTDLGSSCVGVHPHALRRKGLEQRAKPCSRCLQRPVSLALEQPGLPHSYQPGRQCGID